MTPEQRVAEPPIARYRLTLTIKGNTLDEIAPPDTEETSND